MATFAELDINNKVLRVLSVHDNQLLENGIESEQKGIQFLKSLYGENTIWKQTSYNTRGGKHYNPDNTLSLDQTKAFRKNHAGVDKIYDETRNAFISLKPYNSWTLNEETCLWEAPISYPQDGNRYDWNEETLSWILY
jgi:hypothetical protein